MNEQEIVKILKEIRDGINGIVRELSFIGFAILVGFIMHGCMSV
tara:strand:+ start:142 stop:273 length:132 start_codon:yes stop_codon:yes gene_type:complete